jgi:hypothetical protein
VAAVAVLVARLMAAVAALVYGGERERPAAVAVLVEALVVAVVVLVCGGEKGASGGERGRAGGQRGRMRVGGSEPAVSAPGSGRGGSFRGKSGRAQLRSSIPASQRAGLRGNIRMSWTVPKWANRATKQQNIS